MANFKRNHAQTASKSGDMIAKVGIFGAILGGLYFLFNFFAGGGNEASTVGDGSTVQIEQASEYAGEQHFMPEAMKGGRIYHHKAFSLCYMEDYEQAGWVAYVLEREKLQQPWAERVDNFRPDPSIKSGSATPDDYRGSGYDRGHQVPAADMAFDAEAMDQTFMMSNISPQARNFNQGIWRELEELTRDWANKFARLYVISGPVLTEEPKGYIGKDNKVAVPTAYFKVLLDLEDPEQKAIGFVIPNEVSYEPLYTFVRSVDEVEDITGINFFEDFLPRDLETELEAKANKDLWPFSKRKYDMRVQQWNQ